MILKRIKMLFKNKRFGNTFLMGSLMTIAVGALFMQPFLTSISSGFKNQNENYKLTLVNNMSKEIYDFLYIYKKIKGTQSFKTLIETGNIGDCSNNDLNGNGNLTEDIDGYCISHLTSSGGYLGLNKCDIETSSGTLSTETDIENISCKTNDGTYPDEYYLGIANSFKNTISLKKDILDSDIYQGYIKVEDVDTGISKVINVMFY